VSGLEESFCIVADAAGSVCAGIDNEFGAKFSGGVAAGTKTADAHVWQHGFATTTKVFSWEVYITAQLAPLAHP
jgi:hypothetical protein